MPSLLISIQLINTSKSPFKEKDPLPDTLQTAFHHSFNDMKTADRAVLKLSRASALTLLVIYFLYLLFQLKSHAYLITSGPHQGTDMPSSIGPLVQRNGHSHDRSSSASSFSRTIRFADEDPSSLVRSSVAKNTIELDTVDPLDPQRPSQPNTETNGHSDIENLMNDADGPNRGRQTTPGQQNEVSGGNSTAYVPRFRAHSSSTSQHSLRRRSSQDELPLRHTVGQVLLGSTISVPQLLHRARRSLDSPTCDNFSHAVPSIGRMASLILLLSSSILIAICAEFLVSTIDDMVTHSPLSEPFIGLIILPIAGNVAEHITAMTVAAKNKMDLAIGVSVGSSIQIALFVTPLIVIVGWILDRDMTLYFSLFETVTLVATTFLVNFLILNGKTNYLEGSLLCACYIIIGLAYILSRP
jgi:Ca2+:H+ antiporter